VPVIFPPGDKPGLHRVAQGIHDNGDRRGRLLRRLGRGGTRGKDDVDGELDQLRGEGGETLIASLGVPVLDGEVLALHAAAGAELVHEGVPRPGMQGEPARRQIADPSDGSQWGRGDG
jgi:hypothetical protein